MSVSVPKLFKNHKLSISVRQTKKRGVIYIFDSHFVFCSLKGECRGHVYSWSIKVLQISRIIGSMFSGIIIVTVHIKKGGHIEFEGQIKVILPKDIQYNFIE